MKKSFVVLGLGRFGSNVALALARMKRDVLAIDIDEDSVSLISKEVPHCVIADATKLDVLTELGVGSIDHAIVAIGNNLQASILTIVNLRSLGVRYITVRADMDSHKELYKLIGATEVIVPEEASAISLANQIGSNSILDYYGIAGDYALMKISVGKKFKSKSLIELNVRNNFEVNIVGIIDHETDEFYIPKGTDKLKPFDIVVVAGTKQKMLKFDTFLNS